MVPQVAVAKHQRRRHRAHDQPVPQLHVGAPRAVRSDQYPAEPETVRVPRDRVVRPERHPTIDLHRVLTLAPEPGKDAPYALSRLPREVLVAQEEPMRRGQLTAQDLSAQAVLRPPAYTAPCSALSHDSAAGSTERFRP